MFLLCCPVDVTLYSSIGGHTISDVDKLRQLQLGWELLIERVKDGSFVLTKETVCAIQEVLAHGEALEAGRLRSAQAR